MYISTIFSFYLSIYLHLSLYIFRMLRLQFEYSYSNSYTSNSNPSVYASTLWFFWSEAKQTMHFPVESS